MIYCVRTGITLFVPYLIILAAAQSTCKPLEVNRMVASNLFFSRHDGLVIEHDLHLNPRYPCLLATCLSAYTYCNRSESSRSHVRSFIDPISSEDNIWRRPRVTADNLILSPVSNLHHGPNTKKQSLFNVSYSHFFIITSLYAKHDFGSVHDGWGVAQEKGIDGNAIEAATTTNMDTIAKDHSYRTLLASGTSVGLSEGLMGNSEVGYVLILAF